MRNMYNLYQIDSFTKEKIKGNPAGVITNAEGSLGAYLVHHNIFKHDNSVFNFKAKQEETIGRTGIIEVDVRIENQQPIEVKVSGSAVIVFKTELSLED